MAASRTLYRDRDCDSVGFNLSLCLACASSEF
jgi:hypothetical protein